jgi:Tol biopolymer transport system component
MSQEIMDEHYYGQKPPGITPELYSPKFSFLEGVKTDYIILSPDGKEVCYVIEDTSSEERYDRNYIHYKKMENGKWKNSEIAYFVANQGKGSIPQFSPDGNRFSYSYKGDIWTSVKKSGQWSLANKLSEPINSEKYECGFSLVKSNMIYFASGGRPEGKSKQCDIYCAKMGDSTCVNLSNLNTERSECVLAVDPDEKYIIFTRYYNKSGKDAVDLYISFHKNDGSWTIAQKLDSLFNSSGSNHSPRFSSDGRYFFYSQSVLTYSNMIETKQYWVSTQIFDEIQKSVLTNAEK